jgi:RNase P/RNase MRP subunit p30
LKFLDIHTHSIHSTGTDTPARMLHHAKALGIEIGLCDGVHGEEIRPSSTKELKKLLSSSRAGYTLVRVRGETLNRAAVGDRRVAALVGLGTNRSDMAISPVVAKKAAETGVAVEVNLKALASSKGLQRLRVIKGTKQTLLLKRKYGFPIIASTGAESYMDLRGADLTGALLLALGFTDKEIEEAIYENPKIILRGERL